MRFTLVAVVVVVFVVTIIALDVTIFVLVNVIFIAFRWSNVSTNDYAQ